MLCAAGMWRLIALVVFVIGPGCGGSPPTTTAAPGNPSASADAPPAEPGKVPVVQGTETPIPSGHGLTFDGPGGETIDLPYAQATVLMLETKDGLQHVGIELTAQDRGTSTRTPITFQMTALVPTAASDMRALLGLDLPGDAIALFWPEAPPSTNKVERPVDRYVLMAEGKDAEIFFDEVEPTRIVGRFRMTITDENVEVWKIAEGKFVAYRGPFGDDAAFANYIAHR